MRNISIIALIAAMGPVSAYAEGGTISLSYGQLEGDSSSDVSSLGISGAYERDFGNGFAFEAVGRHNTLDDTSSDGSTASIFANVTYSFQSGLYVGAYAQRLQLDFGSPANLDSYGGIIGYASGPFDVSAFAGITDFPGTGETEDWGLAASYDGGMWNAYAAHQSMAIGGSDATASGLAGSYDLGNNFAIFAGLSRNDLGGPEISGGGIGASYTIDGAFSGVPVVLSAEYSAFSSTPGDDITGMKIMMTVPFGDATGVIPVDSVAGSIAYPGYNAYGALFDTLY